MGESAKDKDSISANPQFATTHWSVVLAAGEAENASEALALLCRIYWYPLYVYVRRSGHTPEDAKDLTQEFFARVFEKRYLNVADPDKGRFRSFLLTALKRFLANDWDRRQRQKRGGGCEMISLDADDTERRYLGEPVDSGTPEKAFERRWAITLLEQVLDGLETEFSAAGKAQFFAALKPFLIGEEEHGAYGEVAGRLAMSAGALRLAVHRLRERYRERLRGEIANTVACPEEIDEEIRYLFVALSG